MEMQPEHLSTRGGLCSEWNHPLEPTVHVLLVVPRWYSWKNYMIERWPEWHIAYETLCQQLGSDLFVLGYLLFVVCLPRRSATSFSLRFILRSSFSFDCNPFMYLLFSSSPGSLFTTHASKPPIKQSDNGHSKQLGEYLQGLPSLFTPFILPIVLYPA